MISKITVAYIVFREKNIFLTLLYMKMKMKMKTRKNRVPVKTIPVTIGKIWAKWCPHCITLIPAWDKMKQIIRKKTRADPQYMEVEESELYKIEQFNKTNPNGTFIDSARGYPTIYKIVGGKVEYYTGEREPKKMAEWALNNKRIQGGTRKLKSKRNRVKV
jgi:thiol-disulfide isomerase/thioredoxin